VQYISILRLIHVCPLRGCCRRELFIIADKARARGGNVKVVGVVTNKELKLEDGEGSHIQGGAGEKGT
jgi:hypothetical protein